MMRRTRRTIAGIACRMNGRSGYAQSEVVSLGNRRRVRPVRIVGLREYARLLAVAVAVEPPRRGPPGRNRRPRHVAACRPRRHPYDGPDSTTAGRRSTGRPSRRFATGFSTPVLVAVDGLS